MATKLALVAWPYNSQGSQETTKNGCEEVLSIQQNHKENRRRYEWSLHAEFGEVKQKNVIYEAILSKPQRKRQKILLQTNQSKRIIL